MPWSEYAQDEALEAVFHMPELWVRLTIGGEELTDPDYEPQEVEFGEPSGIGRRTMSNIDEIRFSPLVIHAPRTIDGFMITEPDPDSQDTGFRIIVRDKVPRFRQLDMGAEVVFRVGELVVGWKRR